VTKPPQAMTAAQAFLQALDVRLVADGETLQVDAPGGVLTADFRAALVAHKAELLAHVRESEAAEQARRVGAFQAQRAAWIQAGRTGVPLLTLPDAPAPTRGHCVSCGTPIPEWHWRCAVCLEALAPVLGLPPSAEAPP
jgi:hypothetical protein